MTNRYTRLVALIRREGAGRASCHTVMTIYKNIKAAGSGALTFLQLGGRDTKTDVSFKAGIWGVARGQLGGSCP